MGDPRRVRPGPLTTASPTPRGWSAALGAVYFTLGLLGATWFSRIPTEQSRLHLSSGTLGIALLGPPVGSLVVSLLAPALLHRWGSRPVATASLIGCGITLALLPLDDRLLTLLGGLLLMGAAQGGLDVSMNANGLALQRRAGRSVFGRLHALWSLGGFAGSGLAGILAAAGVGLTTHLATVGTAAVVVAVPLCRPLGNAAAAEQTAAEEGVNHTSWSRHPTVLLFAAVAVAAFVVEVAAADWGGVFLRHDLHASAGAAAAAYAGFALPHCCVRLFGDPVVDRAPRRPLLVIALLVAAAGYLIVVTATMPVVAVIGLAVAGAGVALVVPVAFSAAGDVAGVSAGAGLATAAGSGYVGWTGAPPVIGGLAALAGLRVGLLLPLVGAVAAASLVARRRV